MAAEFIRCEDRLDGKEFWRYRNEAGEIRHGWFWPHQVPARARRKAEQLPLVVPDAN